MHNILLLELILTLLSVNIRIILMKIITEIEKLKPILNKPVFFAKEARKLGVHSSVLNYYVKQGIIESIGHGVYRDKNAKVNVSFEWEDLIIISKSVPNSVICLISALAIYDLTEEIPRRHWIAIPNSTSSPTRKNTIFKRMRDIDTGKINHQLDGETICIFDIERTIVDAFRFLSLETAIKSLKMGIDSNQIDLNKIMKYAQKFNVKIEPYVHSLMI